MIGKRIVEKIKSVFINALTDGTSPHKLALTCSVGIYIAFSPFPGGHTLLMLAFKWLLGLNLPVLFIVASINNPWTMIPFFTLDHYFGYWLVHTIFELNPPWTWSLAHIFGSGSVCLWSFLIGGNILGILGFLLGYPLFLLLFNFVHARNTHIKQK